jgi:hypothetical protein
MYDKDACGGWIRCSPQHVIQLASIEYLTRTRAVSQASHVEVATIDDRHDFHESTAFFTNKQQSPSTSVTRLNVSGGLAAVTEA